jgi:hypothetical protein
MTRAIIDRPDWRGRYGDNFYFLKDTEMNWTDVLFWSGLGLFGVLLGLLVYRIDQVYRFLYRFLREERTPYVTLETTETGTTPDSDLVSLSYRVTQLEQTCAELQKAFKALEQEFEATFDDRR